MKDEEGDVSSFILPPSSFSKRRRVNSAVRCFLFHMKFAFGMFVISRRLGSNRQIFLFGHGEAVRCRGKRTLINE